MGFMIMEKLVEVASHVRMSANLVKSRLAVILSAHYVLRAVSDMICLIVIAPQVILMYRVNLYVLSAT